MGRPELSKAMIIYQCLLSDQRPWAEQDRTEEPLGKLKIHMGIRRQANPTTNAVVYGRIMESEESHSLGNKGDVHGDGG